MLSRSIVSDSVRFHGLSLTRLLCPRDFSGKNAEVGCHLLLQGIFLTQESNLYLLHTLHWQMDFLLLSQVGSQGRHVTIQSNNENFKLDF